MVDPLIAVKLVVSSQRCSGLSGLIVKDLRFFSIILFVVSKLSERC